VKAGGKLYERSLLQYFTVVCVHFKLTNLASDFAALCLCQQWPYLACFLLGL